MSLHEYGTSPRRRSTACRLLVVSALVLTLIGPTHAGSRVEMPARPARVCPPYPLRDEAGQGIDPVHGVNARVPYSPRQTCGAAGCHDYPKITQGYHFMQGRDEAVPSDMASRFEWVTSPGNYGGAWCSPAPLYRFLSARTNASAAAIDMTSATFVTAGCGNCHPGGGPLEFDRDGRRYDQWMLDPASGLTSGGDNDFDGDYFKARWAETGVVEADCLLCHLPEYRFKRRNDQLARLNFRWAATEGAGFAVISGSVASNEVPQVNYDLGSFDANGNVRVRVVTQPRNETCLQCHAQPGWKKRGADFRARTDVHLRAGLRCVDCHSAGSNADDPRIRGREVHQFGKGDDPGGRVRDDLDNTVRDCASCHSTGRLGAPVAKHSWLPPLHLEIIACQTCHTPEKSVMPIQVQAGDVFNRDAWIDPGGKQLWTFYGVNGAYRNHYGILKVMGYDDKPTERFQPVLAFHKGKIYPVNRVHSTWPGIETPGRSGLMQPRPADIHRMWKMHFDDPDQFPELARIKDDNGDGAIEIDRSEEVDALIAAVTRHLTSVGHDLTGKRVVWVSNERVYHSGTEYREVDKAEWEASPYANVHKYNHDVAPARAALGSGGCTDCHASNSRFFDQPILLAASTPDDGPRWGPNATILGYSPASIRLGAFREETLKPLLYGLLATLLGLAVLLALRRVAVDQRVVSPHAALIGSWLGVAGLMLASALVLRSPGLAESMTARRLTLDAAHFGIGAGILLAGLILALQRSRPRSGDATAVRRRGSLWISLAVTVACGIVILLKPASLPAFTRWAYTGFDCGLTLTALACVLTLGLRLARPPAVSERPGSVPVTTS